jgi:hypothetical protein
MAYIIYFTDFYNLFLTYEMYVCVHLGFQIFLKFLASPEG